MLVLTRLRDETMMIGNDIELTVVDIKGDKVRLGIKAPTNIPVHRKEVYEAIQREKEQAAKLRDRDIKKVKLGSTGTGRELDGGLNRGRDYFSTHMYDIGEHTTDVFSSGIPALFIYSGNERNLII